MGGVLWEVVRRQVFDPVLGNVTDEGGVSGTEGGQIGGGAEGLEALTESERELLEIGVLTTGYALHYVWFLLLVVLNAVLEARHKHYEETEVGHKAVLPKEGITQRGYRFGRLGFATKCLDILFVVWLQVSMIVTIGTHYSDVWPWTPGETRMANWDSFARAFLMAWISSLVLLGCVVLSRTRAQSFFLKPCPLSEAQCVAVTKSDKDESGNIVISYQICKVSRLSGGPAMVEIQLLRYPYCRRAAAFTAHPDWQSLEGSERHSHTELDRLFTGKWAKERLEAGGLTSAGCVHATDGVQGKNEIDVHIPSILQACVDEFWTLFYVYQLYAAMISFFWDYISVGLMMLTLIAGSGLFKVVTERMQRMKLKKMATIEAHVWVKRDAGWEVVHCRRLCVGDLVCLTAEAVGEGGSAGEEVIVSADCILVSGNCVADESFLTGETMPIQKFEIPKDDKPRNPETGGDKKHFLYSGTTLLHAVGAEASQLPQGVSSGAFGIVTHTGARSTRGSLLRSLLFGSPLKLQFAAESKVVLALLVSIAMVDFAAVNIEYSFSMSSILTALFMVISMVNPLLSVAVMGGQLAAARRLSAARTKGEQDPRIFVRDVDRMALAGRVDVICFDKTGTITKSGLDFVGVVPAAAEQDATLPFSAPTMTAYDSDQPSSFVVSEAISVALAVTHTVSRLGERLIGHQVELRMVEASESVGWKYSADMRSASQWQIEQQWTFDHHTMTMSVLVTQPDKQVAFVFCKGSFEAVSQRCSEKSRDLLEPLAESAERLSTEGCYVLAVARKKVAFSEATTMSRREAEAELEMVGLMVFRNEPKPDSADAIRELRAGLVECVMVTGDSALTGAAIAKAVGIVPAGQRVVLGSLNDGVVQWRDVGGTGEESSEELAQGATSAEDLFSSDQRDVCLAVTGDAFHHLMITDQAEELMSCRGCGADAIVKCRCARIRIYGRMAPHQKVQCVRLYAGMQHTVGMCGDGGNDSGALRAAHTGLALSGRAEASVAAPFSTAEESIGAMVLLLREGRGSLCTSFAAYRFIVVRGMVWTQLKNACLIIFRIYMSPLAYLYVDLLSITLLLWGVSLSKPAQKLSATLPEGSLLGPQNVIAGIIGVVLPLISVAILFAFLSAQPWYLKFQSGPEISEWSSRSDNFEAPLMLLWFGYFSVELAVVYSFGHHYRQSVLRNMPLMVSSLFLVLILFILLFSSETRLSCMFKVNCDPDTYASLRFSWVNAFLFKYEKVGGLEWFAPVREEGGSPVSTNYSTDFKVGLFFLMIFFTAVHVFLYRWLVLGWLAQEYCPDKLGWGDAFGIRLLGKIHRGKAKAIRFRRRLRRIIGLREKTNFEMVELNHLDGSADSPAMSPQKTKSPAGDGHHNRGVFMEEDVTGMTLPHDNESSEELPGGDEISRLVVGQKEEDHEGEAGAEQVILVDGEASTPTGKGTKERGAWT